MDESGGGTDFPESLGVLSGESGAVSQDSGGVPRLEAELDEEIAVSLIGQGAVVHGYLRFLEGEGDGHDGHVLTGVDLRSEDAVVERLR